MIKYIIKRIFNYIVMLFVATSLTYFVASFAMNPRSNYLQRHPVPPAETINNSLNKANINDQVPVIVRYGRWLKGIVTQWNWGLAPDGSSVNDAVATRIVASVQILTLGTILGIVIGIAIGVYTAIRQYRWQDRTLQSLANFFLVMPPAVLGILVAFGAIAINTGVGQRLFYVTGLHSYQGSNPWLYFVDFLQHLILPTIVLTIPYIVSYHLHQRTYLLDVMNADYVRTARAKGLTLNQAIRKHALRNALIPTTVDIAFSISGIFTGAVITESIFAIHGLGSYFTTTINQNDINGAVAIAAFGGVCTLAGALMADIFAAWIDPRIRLS